MKKRMMIYLSENQNITDFMRLHIKNTITKRYKIKHLAEDMNVSYPMMNRFINSKPVGQHFFVQWFDYFSKDFVD
jgi:hypothetical protein